MHTLPALATVRRKGDGRRSGSATRIIDSQLRDSVGFAPTSPAPIVAAIAGDDHTTPVFIFWRQYSHPTPSRATTICTSMTFETGVRRQGFSAASDLVPPWQRGCRSATGPRSRSR